jgi:DNA-binding NarL/FixJ family response regulator
MNRTPGRPAKITPELREKILSLTAYGCTGREIGQRLGISGSTVCDVLRKSGVKRAL